MNSNTISGSLLDSHMLSVLNAHLERHFECRTERPIPIEYTLPPLAQIDDLQDQVNAVLSGNPAAVSRFRAEIMRMSGGRRRKGVSDWLRAVVPSRKFCSESVNDEQEKPADIGHPLLPAERWLSLVAATVYSARTSEELAVLLEALIDGIEGYGALIRLFDLARTNSKAGAENVASAYKAYLNNFTAESLNRLFDAMDEEGGLTLLHHIRPIAGGTAVIAHDLDPSLAEIPPDLPPWMLDCLRESTVRLQLSGYGVAGDGYEITLVEPDTGCPGDTIVIEGRGFDGVEAVEFTGDEGQSVRATPISVDGDRIEVEFPDDAVTGPVWLYIPQREQLCSGISSLLARPGMPGEIAGGRARVNAFDFYYSNRCLVAGAGENLVWSVEPPGAEVNIIDHFEGAANSLYSGTDADGHVLVRFAEADIGEHRLEITARSACDDVPYSLSFNVFVGSRGARFSVAGVELTQGIQRFNPSNFSDSMNNSVALVGGKDTVVRVYVSNDGGTGSASKISGVLRLNGIEFMPMNRNAAGEPFIELGMAPRRNGVDGTLNFLIPAAAATGTHTAEIDLFNVDACPIATASASHEISWTDFPAFPVTVLRISEPGTGAVITPANALDTITRAFERLPSTMAEVRFVPNPFRIHEGTTEANYCMDGGYYQLALSVAYQHNFDEGTSHTSSWVGIYSRFGCAAGGMMSWPYTSTCISQNDAETVAHEIAHTIGMGHTWAWCDDLFQPVACHRPEPRPGLNTEVVFDIRNNRVILDAPDLQSYEPGFRFLRPEHWEMVRRLMTNRF